LKEEAARHPKVRYWDFVSERVLDLDTAYFYDGYHFNSTGADIYSAYLADLLVREVIPAVGGGIE